MAVSPAATTYTRRRQYASTSPWSRSVSESIRSVCFFDHGAPARPAVPGSITSCCSLGADPQTPGATSKETMHRPGYAEPVLSWYAANARDLPWRRPGASPWAVLVSEIMLQQTPVARVLPVFDEWLARWPTPAALAVEPPGEAVRAWG